MFQPSCTPDGRLSLSKSATGSKTGKWSAAPAAWKELLMSYPIFGALLRAGTE